jgi:CheY-like chemotaxis protein
VGNDETRHALIIEDEVLIALELETLLSEIGYGSFDVAVSLDQAVAAARQRRPDLITADYRIIGGTGLQAVERISAELGPVSVVFVTGNSAQLTGQVSSPVVDKPVTARALRAACIQACLSPFETPPGPGTTEPRLRLLYVDDDVINLRVVREMMEACGVDCLGVPSAQDGLERLSTEGFDLVLMDIHMPAMGGVAALEALRRRPGPNRGIPVVAVTADLSRDAVHYRAMGFDGFVAKPVGTAALLKGVLAALTAARPPARTGFPAIRHRAG